MMLKNVRIGCDVEPGSDYAQVVGPLYRRNIAIRLQRAFRRRRYLKHLQDKIPNKLFDDNDQRLKALYQAAQAGPITIPSFLKEPDDDSRARASKSAINQ